MFFVGLFIVLMLIFKPKDLFLGAFFLWAIFSIFHDNKTESKQIDNNKTTIVKTNNQLSN